MRFYFSDIYKREMANVLKSSSDVVLPMKLVERYYDLTIIQDLKKIQEPIEGLLDPGVLKHISCMSDRRTRPVTYKRYKLENGKEYGRYYAPKGCIQPIKGEIRNMVLNDHAYEVDMRNAHPTIMYQLAKKYEVDLPGIENYVIRRGQILQEVQEQYKVEKEEAKDLFIRLMFGGKLQTWLKDNNIEETDHHEAILDFEDDINILKGVLADKIPEWEDYKKEAVKRNDVERKEYDKNKNKRKKKKVPMNSALAYTLQTIEASIMTDVLEYLQEKKYKTIALVHDGIYVWRDKKPLPDLEELSKLVKEKHDYNLVFDVKSTLPDANDRQWIERVKQHIPEESDDIYEHLDALQVANEIDPAFFDKLNELLPEKKHDIRKDYRAGAEYAREAISRARDYLKDTVYYMRNEGNEFYIECRRNCFGEIIQRSQFSISQLKHTELGIWTRHGSTNWVENILELGLIEPKTSFGFKEGYGVLNIYRRPAIMERVPEPVYTDLEPFTFVVNNICGNHEESIEYFHNYMAFVFQERTLRSQVLMLIYGDLGGAGKTSVMVDLFGDKIFGHDYFKANSKKDLTEAHSSTLYEGKRLLVLEEVTFAGDKNLNAELKDITTRLIMTVNPKHKTQYTIPDRSCLVAMSNSLTPLDLGDRRIFAITPTRALKRDEAQAFHDFIADDKNVRAIYQFYMDRDISNFSPYRDVPKDTQAKKDLMESNNRWVDLKEHMRDFVMDFKHKVKKNGANDDYEWEFHHESNDWIEISTRFNLGHFRDYIAQKFSATRSLGLNFKGTSELGNELKRTLGLKIENARNGWKKESPTGMWVLCTTSSTCVDFKPFFEISNKP